MGWQTRTRQAFGPSTGIYGLMSDLLPPRRKEERTGETAVTLGKVNWGTLPDSFERPVCSFPYGTHAENSLSFHVFFFCLLAYQHICFG